MQENERHYRGDETTGFQSPAQDHIEPVIDLADKLDLRRPARYPVRVIGQALSARGIHHGDVLVVNAAADPVAGKVCVAILDGDVILATLIFKEGAWWLEPSKSDARPVTGDTEIWAIVEALVRFEV
ncbi:MAG: S24 family peptidase [Alphaproteobacteria bacterium]|nr:S24 family peptidase [Alphaproteobacteria bacterium]